MNPGKIGNALKAKTFGMPRYAWIALLAGGLVLGLYLRSKSEPETDTEEDTVGDPGGSIYDYAGDGGLAGVGVLGPPGGSVVPVQTPYLPEGVTDIFGVLGDTIGALGNTIVDQSVTQLEPSMDITGGGAPSVPADAHTAPGRCMPNDRLRLTKINARLKAINARLKVINTNIPEFRKRKNFSKNQTLQQRVQRLATERNALQNERTSLQKQRENLRRKCG